ncbi:MAG: serine/threonine protein phosphatase [Alphaproteobacteria bacterium]|nr:MAG: serine/threonine protein phosphatase [Alphaproteobacteria bacterium]
MKILAFSDLHAARSRAEALVAASAGADLVIGAGDFCNLRQGLPEALAPLTEITAPLVMVAGNNESANELRDAAPPRAHVLHGEAVEISGIRIFGIGGGIPVTPFGSWSWDLTEQQAEALLAGAEGAEVIVSHSPPKGVADRTSTGQSVGSSALRAAIERFRPRLVLCGHVHDCWGQDGMIGRTRVRNLGPTVNWLEI